MALMITGKMIRSDGTRHTAELVRAGAGGAWRVSWLPGRVLTRSQATTAMMIAQALGRIPAAAAPWLTAAGCGVAWTPGRPSSALQVPPPWRGHPSRSGPGLRPDGTRPHARRARPERRTSGGPRLAPGRAGRPASEFRRSPPDTE